MKRFFIAAFLLLTLLVAGCKVENKKILVFEHGEVGPKTWLSLEVQGNRILNRVYLTKGSYSDLGVGDKNEAEALYSVPPAGLKDIKGFELSYDFTEEGFVRELVIDHTTISPDDLNLIVNLVGVWYGDNVDLPNLIMKLEQVGFVRLE